MEESAHRVHEANASSIRTKRKTPACLQCRDRKVRCSGTCPCVNCTRRSETCVYEQDEKKVLVSERYLDELKRKAGIEEPSDAARPAKRRLTDQEASARPRDQSGHPGPDEDCSIVNTSSAGGLEPPLKNPLVESPSKFLTDVKGRRRFLGPSSTWAYSRHVISLLKDHLHHHESPDVPQNVDGTAFPLHLPQIQLPEDCLAIGTLPPLDYAIYLTNTVKFHIAQTYHLFDETVFMENLFSLYNSGVREMTPGMRLWLSQFFIIMAFGKALLHRGFSKASPFGKDYFLRGMEFLPGVDNLYDNPILAIEVCCAIGLYLQSVDHRFSAYIYLGIGLRVALGHGMHHDPVDDPETRVQNERQRSAWWTLYVLDRKFSCLMGTPSPINDASTTTALPGSPYYSPQKVAALDVHVKLSKLIGKVVDTVYAVDGRLPASFLRIMQSTLRDLAALAETLTSSVDMNFDESNPINKISGTLSLCYHQCIILATRPLLVFLLRERLARPTGPDGAERGLAEPIKALIRTSCDSANQSLCILKALQSHDLLGKSSNVFLPFDLEFAFSAAFILMLTNAIRQVPDAVDPDWFETVLSIIHGQKESGQVSAGFRHQEVERLHEMLSLTTGTGAGSAAESSSPDEGVQRFENGGGLFEGVSSSDMLSVADLMNRFPVAEMDAGLLEGDWLWEGDMSAWPGVAVGDESDQTIHPG